MMEAEQVARPRNAAAGYLAGLSSDQHHCPRLHLTWSPPLVPPTPSPRQGCVAWSASAAAGCSVASPETGLELYNQHYSQVTEASLLSRS